MKKSDFVIIGGVAAGPKAAATLARRLPEASITLYQKEDELSYATCGMPFFASGEISGFEELLKTAFGVTRDADFFRSSRGFEAVTGAEAVRIDRDRKTVTVRMLATDEIFEHQYDKLVLATGALPNMPHFEVGDSPFIRSFTRPEDAREFRKVAEKGQIGEVAIVGSGFIGCELAEAVTDMWGIAATVIEKENQILPYVLDPEMAAIVERDMSRRDIQVWTDCAVEKIELGEDGRPVVRTCDHDPIAVDYVFLCVGVHPNVDLAREAGLEIGSYGGIVVDDTMRTSDPEIYAGGDCVESTHQLTGGTLYLPMGSIANRHGRVIAENLSGHETRFPGVLGACILRMFDLNVGSVGLNERAASAAGLKTKAVWGSFTDKPDYFPEAKSFVLKMVYDERTDALLGLQAVGAGDICRRIDVFSSFLQRKGAVEDLFDFEQAYAPPFSEALDPLHHMAGIARALQRGMNFVSPDAILNGADAAIFVDVREPDEIEAESLSNIAGNRDSEIIAVPLNYLKGRLADIPNGKPLVVLCKRGARAYQAAVILKAGGYKDVKVVGGGLQALL